MKNFSFLLFVFFFSLAINGIIYDYFLTTNYKKEKADAVAFSYFICKKNPRTICGTWQIIPLA